MRGTQTPDGTRQKGMVSERGKLASLTSSDDEVGGRGRPRGMEAERWGGVGGEAEGRGLWVLGDVGGVVILGI